MTRQRLIRLAIVAGLLAVGAAHVRGQDASSASLSKAEFLKLAELLQLQNQRWATIPWKVSVTEARQLAFKERKPIFLVVNTGNCLGWT